MSVSSSINVLRGRGRSISDLPLPISREATIRVDDSEREDGEYRAKLVGYTTDGAPIIQFMEVPPTFKPERGSVIGKSESGEVIVVLTVRHNSHVLPKRNNDLATLALPNNRAPFRLERRRHCV